MPEMTKASFWDMDDSLGREVDPILWTAGQRG